MFTSVKAELTSAAPLIINNNRLANPLDEYAKSIKRITSKRAKTDADLEEIAKLEWYGSLYLDKDNHLCLPGFLVEAALINAAKKSKQGMQAKSGMFVKGDAALTYNGPSVIDELWEDKQFVFSTLCRPQGRGSVLRTRPIFAEWSATIEVEYDDEQLNFSDIERFITTAGRIIGFGNWRPRYGRFDARVIA